MKKTLLLALLAVVLGCLLVCCTGNQTTPPAATPTPSIESTPTPTPTPTPTSIPTPTEPAVIAVTEIKADKEAVSLYQGRTATLSYTILPEDATDQGVEILVENPEIASFENGVLTALAPGATTLTFKTTDGGHTATVSVEVLEYIAVEQIVTEFTELTLDKGDSLQLSFKVLPENATKPELAWQVDAKEVLSLKKDGIVKGLAEGVAVITVTCKEDGVSATVTVTVIPHENHRMGEWEIAFPASCKDPGMRIRYCEICGSEKYDFEAIEKTEHVYGETVVLVAPTRAQNGKGEQACNGCEDKKELVLRMTDLETAYGKLGKNIEFSFYEDGELYIRGDGQLYSWSADCPNPLKELKNVQKVFFTGSVELISDFTFEGMTGIRYVQLPEGLKLIGARAFYGCSGIEEINMPSTLQFVNGAAFLGCEKIKTLQFAEGLLGCGQGAFEGCTSLESVSFPASLETLGSRSFAGCTSLRVVELSASALLTEIPTEAFRNCGALEAIVLPDSVKTIGMNAFSDCVSLLSAVLTGCETLDFESFCGCTALETLSFGKSLKSIGYDAFKECLAVKTVNYSESKSTFEGQVTVSAGNEGLDGKWKFAK